MKEFVITLAGPTDVINAGLDSFARQHGWTESNPLTREEYGRNVLAAFIRSSVTGWNAGVASRAAMTAATEQTVAALDAATLTLVVS